MKSRSSFLILLALAFSSVLVFLGCRIGGRNEAGPGPEEGPGGAGTLQSGTLKTGTVSFRVVVPQDEKVTLDPERSIPIGNILALETATAPVVTVKLILVNVGNEVEKTTEISKTVSVNGSGTAEASFFGVPALTCVGDVEITNGRIGSYSTFHGATDLVAGADNVVVLGPKQRRCRETLLADLVMRIVGDSGLFAKAVPRLVSLLSVCLEGRDPDGTSVVEDALAQFGTLAGKTGTFQVSSGTQVLDSPVTTGGGTFTAPVGSSLAGLEVQVPPGAFDQTVQVKVMASPVATHSLPAGFSPVSPLLAIDDGGQVASEPVRVKIPVTVATDKIPVAVRFDSVTGKLESIPIVAVDGNSVTIATRDLSGRHSPNASVRVSVLPIPDLLTGIIILEIGTAMLPNSVDSGFKPGVHSWKNPNCGSCLAPGGHCAGSVISAQWAFYKGVVPTIYGNYDRFNTPEIWEDDVDSIRLNSVVQKDIHWGSVGQEIASWVSSIDDRLTFHHFKAALYLTKEPQLIGMRNEEGGHALLVTRLQEDTLFIVDPNFPEEERQLLLKDGKFQPFSASLDRDSGSSEYLNFYHIGVWSLIHPDQLAKRWAEFRAGTIGQDKFPAISLWGKIPDGSFTELKDGFRSYDGNLYLAVKIGSTFQDFVEIQVFRRGSASPSFPTSRVTEKTTTGSDVSVFTIPLHGGSNTLGFQAAMGTQNWGYSEKWYGSRVIFRSWETNSEWCYAKWVDFKWVSIDSPPPPPSGITAKPFSGRVEVSWQPVEGTIGYRVYWQAGSTVVPATASKANASSTSCIITGLTNGTTHYFRVSAIGTDGWESVLSAEVTGVPQKTVYASRKVFYGPDNSYNIDVISDMTSNLQWLCFSANSWESANAGNIYWVDGYGFINVSTIDGGGWRLPTMAELKTLFPDAYDSGFFRQDHWLWSSEPSTPDNPDTIQYDPRAKCYSFRDDTSGSWYTYEDISAFFVRPL